MKYLGYFEVIESSGWVLSDSIDDLKGNWCFSMRIFDVGDMTKEELDKIESPKFNRIFCKYDCVYSEGSLMHSVENHKLKQRYLKLKQLKYEKNI